MHPGSFAVVMATGIMAVAAEQQELDRLAQALYVIALGAYIVLALLLGTRMATHRARVVADLTSHTKGFAFLTVVAGTNDYAYGQTACKKLATKTPNKAINNADSHEYFAENNPFQN